MTIYFKTLKKCEITSMFLKNVFEFIHHFKMCEIELMTNEDLERMYIG